jgi:hypothetical protein
VRFDEAVRGAHAHETLSPNNDAVRSPSRNPPRSKPAASREPGPVTSSTSSQPAAIMSPTFSRNQLSSPVITATRTFGFPR